MKAREICSVASQVINTLTYLPKKASSFLYGRLFQEQKWEATGNPRAQGSSARTQGGSARTQGSSARTQGGSARSQGGSARTQGGSAHSFVNKNKNRCVLFNLKQAISVQRKAPGA